MSVCINHKPTYYSLCIHPYIHTYILYHFVGPQILLYKQSDIKLVRKNNTQTKETKTQYKTEQIYRCQYYSLQMSILQSPNVNTAVSKCQYYSLQMSILQSPNVSTTVSKCQYYSLQMSILQSPNVSTTVSKCQYY